VVGCFTIFECINLYGNNCTRFGIGIYEFIRRYEMGEYEYGETVYTRIGYNVHLLEMKQIFYRIS
jgi:hypothetical protein